MKRCLDTRGEGDDKFQQVFLVAVFLDEPGKSAADDDAVGKQSDFAGLFRR